MKQPPEVFYEKMCSYKLQKIHRKTPTPESFFIKKIAGLRAAALLKKKLWHRCFPVNFAKCLRNVISKHLWTTASDFICSVFFIFSILKNFRHEKSHFVRKKVDWWKTGLKLSMFVLFILWIPLMKAKN